MYISSLSVRRSFIVFMLGLVILGTRLPVIQSLASRRIGIQSAGKINYYPGWIGSNVWKADLETGNMSQFSGIEVDAGNLLEVTSTLTYNESYSMHVHKEEGISRVMGIHEVSPIIYDFHVTFAFMIENFAADGWVRLVELRPKEGTTKIIYFDLYPDGAQIYFIGGKTSKFTIVGGQWHVVNIFISSDKNGMIFIYLDGQQLVKISGGLDLTDYKGDPYNLGRIWIGVVYSKEGAGHGDVYYDEIRLNEWIPPERPPQSPVVEFIYYPTVPKPNETVYFFGHYSSDIDGNITGYEWTFSDGSNVEEVNASYTFNSEGEYQVSLTVTDDSDMNTTLTRTILVYEREPVPVVGGWNVPLRTNGTRILDSLGNDVTLNLTGVAKMGINYGNPAQVTWREVDPAYYESDAQLMTSWGIRLHRVPLNWYWYMTDHEYREIIRDLVDAYTSNGMLVVMDVHSYNFRGYASGGTFPQLTDLTKDFAWQVGRDAILCLKAAAHDFLYNPMVIGVEINEFRPRFPEDYMYNYLFKFELAAELTDEVHAVNPDLLVFMEFGQDGWNSRLHDFDSIRPQSQGLIAGRTNIVYAPHIYFSERYGRSYIWEIYLDGDLEGGKAEMYRVLDAHYLYEQNYYNLPIIVSEWASQSRTPQVILDEMDYFISHNWGSAYWAWFRANIHDEHLLETDWETPSSAGEAFREKLDVING